MSPPLTPEELAELRRLFADGFLGNDRQKTMALIASALCNLPRLLDAAEENARLREVLKEISHGLPKLGCGDSACMTRKSYGMCTNGGCCFHSMCSTRQLVGGIAYLRSKATAALGGGK